MKGEYSAVLVLLSLAVAVMASWSALDLARRVTSGDSAATRLWLVTGALVLGSGIWSMHFVGMLAFSLPIKLGYDVLTTVFSWFIAVLVSLLALFLATWQSANLRLVLGGSVMMGLGVSAMHYSGMAAMRITPAIQYDPLLFAASVLIAILASATALFIIFHLRGLRGSSLLWRKCVSALVMGFAITGMHYTGMAAARFDGASVCLAANDLDPGWLAVTVAMLAIGFMMVGIVAAIFDHRMEQRTNKLSSQLRVANGELMHAALHDALTDLPNRVSFDARLDAATRQARAHNGKVAVLYIDLDGFKPINDVLGHHVGDEVLRQVAQRLRTGLREDDFVARIGGDEFVLVSQGPMDRIAAGRLAQRIVDATALPIHVVEQDIHVSASVGVALFPDDGDETRVLVCADAAMYAAKHAGRNTWRLFSEDMTGTGNDILGMQRAIRRALDEDEFVLHYQPKVSALDGSLRGVEALIRWQDPQRGMVSPGEFIPVAERFGLINAIGFWTLRQACCQARDWQRAGQHIQVAVNLSAQQFRQPDLVERVRACIEEFGIDPALLALEITESVVMETSSSARRALDELKQMGVTLSIDDFGTGYSSLAYLCRLPARQLKIDRSFVVDMDAVAEARTVVEAVIRLAHSLRMEVVAEGVERAEQVALLRALGCDLIQGYYFSRPVLPAQIEALLASGQLPLLVERAVWTDAGRGRDDGVRRLTVAQA
jgi:diguanylate cyclase